MSLAEAARARPRAPPSRSQRAHANRAGRRSRWCSRLWVLSTRSLPRADGAEKTGWTKREVRHHHVAPGELLAQHGRRRSRSPGRRGGRAQAGGEPQRAEGRARSCRLGREGSRRRGRRTPRCRRARPDAGRTAGEVVPLAPDQGVHEHLEAVAGERAGQGEAAEVPARERGVDLQPGHEQHAWAAGHGDRHHAARATSWVLAPRQEHVEAQTRDQYRPGRPAAKERHSVRTVSPRRPTRRASASSAKSACICGCRRRRAQVSMGRTKPDLGRSKSAGSSRASATSRRSCFFRGRREAARRVDAGHGLGQDVVQQRHAHLEARRPCWRRRCRAAAARR